MREIEDYRNFLKADYWAKRGELESDQKEGKPVPPIQKDYSDDSELIDLVPYEDLSVGEQSVKEVIKKRRSRRRYNDRHLTKEELSYLLWATQGMEEDNHNLRTVPSGGARHPFETYLYINRVKDIEPGLYRYLPIEHKLIFIHNIDELGDKVSSACLDQRFVKNGAVVFFWTAVPYRSEWRYSILAHKVIALDAGHLCQNLYLASESIGAGSCAIGAYEQSEVDKLLRVDGEEEFTIYIASVGKVD